MTIKDQIHRIILENEKFVITSHVNPDGDAIGSELALARYIFSLGKKVRIINHSHTPEYLLFMLDEDEVFEYNSFDHDKEIAEADVIFLLDLNQWNRTGSLSESLQRSAAKVVCIDHHEYPDEISDILFIDTTKASTGELIYDLLVDARIKISYELALPIYVAILTDTGSFRFDRTTPDVHRIIAELLETGINPKAVYHKIYEQGTSGRIQLLGKALNSLQLCCNDKVSYMVITKTNLTETGTTDEDVEGFVNYCLTIKGVEVGLFFYEKEEEIKVSFRSAEKVPVNKFAAHFGGGGHFHAAGASFIMTDIEIVKQTVLDQAKIFIEKHY